MKNSLRKSKRNEQFSLHLKEDPLKNFALKLRSDVRKSIQIYFRIKRMNDPILWLTIALIASSALVLYQKLKLLFADGISVVPLFSYQYNLKERLVSQKILRTTPIVLVTMLLAIIVISSLKVKRYRAEIYLINLTVYLSLVVIVLKLSLLTT